MDAGEKILMDKSEALFALCEKYRVLRLKAFGSATRDDFDPTRSDIDFAVEFGAPPAEMGLATQFFGLLEELEQLFGRHVDLLEESAIKNSRMRKTVAETAVTLYAA